MRKIFLLFLSVILFHSVSYSENLLEVYHQATLSDPAYQAARAQYLSDTEKFPQARAQLLPNIGLSMVTTHNQTKTFNAIINVEGFVGSNQFYNTQYTLNFSQPILNFSNLAKAYLAKAQVAQAQAVYASTAQDLMLRVTEAYFNALLSEDNLRFIEAQKKAIGRQLDQAKQRYQVGLDAITSVYDAQASYDSIVAQEIDAQNQVINNRENLRKLTNHYYAHLARFSDKIPLVKPNPSRVDSWVNAATAQNLDVVAARFETVAAKRNIESNAANHLPTLTATGQLNRIRSSDTDANSPGDRDTAIAGLQLELPIYQGGLIVSQTRQAQFDYQKASANLEAAYLDAMVKTRQTFNSIVAGISKIKADDQAIISNQSSVDSTDSALKVGTRTIVDLLNAQQKLLQAQRILAEDQYAYLQNTLVLKKLTGTLNIRDLSKINAWLEHSQAQPHEKK